MSRSDSPLLPTRAFRRLATTSRRATTALLVALLGLCSYGSSPARAQLTGGEELPLLVQIDVPSVEVEGQFELDGQPFSPTPLDGGTVSLESATGETTALGQSWDQSYGPFRMIPGEYTPRYSSFFLATTAPLGNATRFTATRLLDEDRIWDLDVTSVSLRLNFLLNGATAGVGGGEDADFFLRDVESGEEIFIGSFTDGSVDLRVIPGQYDVFYSYRSGVFLPQNEHARILEAVSVTADMELDVDVPSVYRVFSFLMNGAPFPVNAYNYGRFHLENSETGDRFYIGQSWDTPAVRLVPGSYDVAYEARENGAGIVPINENAVVEEALVISSLPIDTTQVDVTAVQITPEFTQNGAGFVISAYDNGDFFLESREGDRFKIGETESPAESMMVVAGVYDVIYENNQPGETTPSNPFVRFVTGLVIDENGPLPFDLPASMLDFSALLDGEPFPNSSYNYGKFHIVGEGEGNSFVLGDTYEGSFSAWLVSGEYDIVYRVHEPGGLVPMNTWHVVAKDVVLPLEDPLALDIRTELIAPRFSLDGAPFPADAAHHGEIFLRDWTGDSVALGETHLTSPDILVIEGAYRVEYEWGEGTDVPQNAKERIGLIEVPEPGLASGLAAGMFLFGLFGTRRSPSVRGL